MKNLKKVTKKQIRKAIAEENRTKLFQLAKLSGIDVTFPNGKVNVYNFIKENANTIKGLKSAYIIALYPSNYKELNNKPFTELEISYSIRYAKIQKQGKPSNYDKILIIGNKNIYWAHPVYKHSDYNKWVAFLNNEKNRIVAEKINKYLANNRI